MIPQSAEQEAVKQGKESILFLFLNVFCLQSANATRNQDYSRTQ